MRPLEQLAAANRVVDMEGKPCPLDYLFEQMYRLRRVREVDGPIITIVDVFTSDRTCDELGSRIEKYMASKYGERATKLMDVAQEAPIPHLKFDILEVGASLAIIPSRLVLTPGERQHIQSDDQLWFIEMADITLDGGVKNPERHLIIKGIKGFVE